MTLITKQRVGVGADAAEDARYFGSYGKVDCHRMMLEDQVRTEAYLAALSPELVAGKIVLDVGCGTGVLSIFAARAGAAKVFAVDGSKGIAEVARSVVKHNGLDKVIEVIHSEVEDLTLPGDVKVDIIVSEWMGYALLYEGMFASVIQARDRHLKPEGVMVPSHCTIKGVPFSWGEFVDHKEQFWQAAPYGIDFAPVAKIARESACRAPVIEVLPDPECSLSFEKALWSLDCKTVTLEEIGVGASMIANFDFDMILTAPFHGLALWFDCTLAGNVVLPTGPEHTPTHWQQTLLFLEPTNSVAVGQGDRCAGTIEMSLASRDLKFRVAAAIKKGPNRMNRDAKDDNQDVAFEKEFLLAPMDL